MQRSLTTAVVLAFLGAGCLDVPASGASAGGATSGGLPPGAPCASDGVCASLNCGLTGTGNCCATVCSTADPTCGVLGCDDGGACIYPPAGTACAPALSCSGQNRVVRRQCDGLGSCSVESEKPCPNNFACNDSPGGCNTSCGSSADCASGFSCNAGACVAPESLGTCTENDDCVSGVCDLGGTGYCCAGGCAVGAPCGSLGCDPATGDCKYPGSAIRCGQGGDAGYSCQDGKAVSCAPFDCRAGGCLTSCSEGLAGCTLGSCDMTLPGCSAPSPELTQWNGLSYTAELPAGTDLQIDVRITNSLNPAVIGAATSYTVCDSVAQPASSGSCPRNADGSIDLSFFNLPQGSFLTVLATLIPSNCGGALEEVPTLSDLTASVSCAKN